jgi:phage/plasmid-like protein (TIGR03299 family)
MAHELWNNDHMFSVKRVPWHGLGTVLEDNPSTDDALIAAKLNWHVACEELFTADGEEVTHRAVRRLDTREILGVVGPDWEPLQNDEGFAVFNELVAKRDLCLETAGSLKNGRRVWILAKVNVPCAEIGKDDICNPYVLLSNAHDGSQALRFGFTPIRVVCNNTLTAAHESGASKLIRCLHTKNIKETVESLRDMMDLAKRTFEFTWEQYRYLAGKGCSEQDLLRYVRKVFKIEEQINEPHLRELVRSVTGALPSETENTKRVDTILTIFNSSEGSQIASTRNTWWTAYNAVNEYLLHDKGRSSEARINSLWFGDGKSIDKRALEEALEFARAA